MSNSPRFFRRVAPAVLIGTAAVAVVALFDPALGGSSDAAPLASAPLGQQPSTTQRSTGGASSGQDTQSQDIQPQDTQPQSAPSQDTQSQTATSCDAAQEVVGDSINTRWGPVQVAARVADGQLCQVYAIDAPHNDGHSARITQQVVPYLDEVATQVGTSFDAVSGATYTSEGYRDSLQSILDQI
jgi:uncharacterized protein with FMN-binding domain